MIGVNIKHRAHRMMDESTNRGEFIVKSGIARLSIQTVS